tara:strand:+ start:1491 stop:2105 length:615 start_codon:yes stop_codon:yes gene_type:complete
MNHIKKIDYNFIKSNNSKKTIVAFHGWQGNKDSFLPLIKHELFKDYSWYLLQGPYMVENDTARRTWSYEVKPGKWAFEEPKKLISNLFYDEIFKKFDSKNVYAIGFSLGALVCYEIVCNLNKTLGAIFPLSGFVSRKIVLNDAQKDTPIIIGHGTNDQIVPYERSKEVYEILKKQNANVKLVKYDSQHNIPIKMLTKISQIIEK